MVFLVKITLLISSLVLALGCLQYIQVKSCLESLKDTDRLRKILRFLIITGVLATLSYLYLLFSGNLL